MPQIGFFCFRSTNVHFESQNCVQKRWRWKTWWQWETDWRCGKKRSAVCQSPCKSTVNCPSFPETPGNATSNYPTYSHYAMKFNRNM